MNKGYFLRSVILGVLVAIHTLPAEEELKNRGAANTGFQLIEEPVAPAVIGAGGAGTAAISSGFDYNPAAPGFSRYFRTSLDFGMYPDADIKRSRVYFTVPHRLFFWGLGFRHEKVEEIYSTDRFGNIPDTDNPGAVQTGQLSLNGGFHISEFFSFGVSVNGLFERILDYSSYGVTVNTGMMFTGFDKRLTTGVSLLNAGTSTSYLDSTERLGQGSGTPLNVRTGISWNDTINSLEYRVSGDVVYRSAGEMVIIPAGIEIDPVQQLSLRIGKRFNHPTELMNFGAGLSISELDVDISFSLPKLIEDVEFKWNAGISWVIREIGLRRDVKQIEGEEIHITPEPKPDRGVSDKGEEGETDTDDIQEDSIEVRTEEELEPSVFEYNTGNWEETSVDTIDFQHSKEGDQDEPQQEEQDSNDPEAEQRGRLKNRFGVD